MKVTHKTIRSGQKIDKNTTYIVYVPGNAEDVRGHSLDENWSWCDKNTVIDLCNHPYHSEWHNPDVLGRSKFRSTAYNIITFTSFIAAIATLCLFTPLVLAIPASIFLGVAFLVTTLLINNVLVRANAKFYTRGEDSVAVGVKRVLDLLVKGVHPNNIILKGNSIGGGVAAEIYKKFESEGIHLRCQISTSFSSIADVLIPIDDSKKESWLRKLVRSILKIGHWDIETYKTINSITPYTMFFNNEGDQVIEKHAQLVTKVREMEKNGEKKNSQAAEDKIFELLFKKHTMLKPNAIGKGNLECNGNNTHCFPMNWLESTESSHISAENLHYLFTYLPYHMDVLHTVVENPPVEQCKTESVDLIISNILQYIKHCKLRDGSYIIKGREEHTGPVFELLTGVDIRWNTDDIDMHKNNIRTKLKERKSINELKAILIDLKLSNCENQKEKLSFILEKVLLNSSVEEIKELQTLINELSQDEHCLTQNQNYSKENFKEKFEKLGKWVEKYNISFVDLDRPKDPNGFLITHASNPCVQLLSNEASLA